VNIFPSLPSGDAPAHDTQVDVFYLNYRDIDTPLVHKYKKVSKYDYIIVRTVHQKPAGSA